MEVIGYLDEYSPNPKLLRFVQTDVQADRL
jgi:hypothetical protein